MEIIFPLLLVVALLEIILSVSWNRLYFTVGVPVFSYEVPRTISTYGRKSHSELENAIPESKYIPLKFRRLSENVVGFQESSWPSFTKITYTAVMHGNLKYTDRGIVKVTGLVNWFPVVFSISFCFLTIGTGSNSPIAYVFPLFLVAILTWIYVVQKKRFIEVAEIAAGIL